MKSNLDNRQVKTNTTMSDASILYENTDGGDDDANLYKRVDSKTKTPAKTKPSQVKTRRQEINIQHISPIKSDSNDYHVNFSHSTPNHHLSSSPATKRRTSHSPGIESSSITEDNVILPIFKQNRTKFQIPISYEKRDSSSKPKSELSNKKQQLIRELAANILDLNKLRSNSERLDAQLKVLSNDQKNFKAKEQTEIELEKLKGEMLNKIDIIHELELDLVKIEGSKSELMKKNEYFSSVQSNNNIMNEIRSTLKEMIHTQSNSVNRSTATLADHGGAALTVNEMLEEVEKAAARTATSLLSTIVKPHPISLSPDLNSGASSSLSSNALNKIDTFKAQIEEQNTLLKRKLTQLEEKVKNYETSNSHLNEIEQLKNLIVRNQRQFEEDKIRLIKEFEAERNLTSNSNLAVMKKFKDELETKMNEKDNEMRKYLHTLYSFISPNEKKNTNSHGFDSNGYSTQKNSNVAESSFLTEEEEAIARISERIHVLRTRIDTKDDKTYSTVKKQNLNGNNDSDDADTKELVQLNEQIRELKTRMIRKSDDLHRIKTTFITENVHTKTNNVTHSQAVDTERVYIPIQHLNNKFVSDDNLYLIHTTSHTRPALATTVPSIKESQQTLQSNSNNTQYEFNLAPKYLQHARREEFSSSSSNSEDDTNHKSRRLSVIMNNNNNNNNRTTPTSQYTYSPERKYTSSIEIPAEQLENLKNSIKVNQMPARRSKSASSTTTTTIIDNNLKDQQSKPSEAKFYHHNGKNLIQVCLKSLKRPQSAKSTCSDQNDLSNGLKKAQKKLEQLKNLIEEKNNQLNQQKMNKFDKEAHDKEMLYLLQLLENQSKKMINLKKKMKDLQDNGNLNSDTVSSISDSIDRMRNDLRDNLKTVNESDIEDTFRKIKADVTSKKHRRKKVPVEKATNEHSKKRAESSHGKVKLVAETAIQTDQNFEVENTFQSDPQLYINQQNAIPNYIMPNTVINEPQYPEPFTPPMEVPLETLVCNIPEHHNLEDLLHQNKEQIINLKHMLKQSQDDLVNQQLYFTSMYDSGIAEKRAEFDALDLAINSRKKFLFDLELRKQKELNNSSLYSDDHYVPISKKGVKFLKDEINCLENTLAKRINELREVDKELFGKKQDLMIKRESKKKMEKDISALIKVKKLLSAQTMLFDKKADEATKQLIIANDDLVVTRERKKSLEDDLNKVKNELIAFLELIRGGSSKGMKNSNRIVNSAIIEKLIFMRDNDAESIRSIQENIDSLTIKHKEAQLIEKNIAKQNLELEDINRLIYKQKSVLQSLDDEILSKKAEIDGLRDRGMAYTSEFKTEIEMYEEEINKLRRQKEELNGDLRKIKQACDELSIEVKLKNDTLQQKLFEIDQRDKNLQQIEMLKTNELNQLNEIEKLIQDKRQLTNKLESDIENQSKDLEQLSLEEKNLKNTIDQLRQTITDNSQTLKDANDAINEHKLIIQKLIGEKLDCEVKLAKMNQTFEKLNEEYRIREEQLNQINNLNKEKQNMVKKEEEELSALENEKQNLMLEAQQIRDKLKKKKVDLEKFDYANKTMDARLNETQNELKKTVEKLKHSKQELDALQDSMHEVKNKLQELNMERESVRKELNEMVEQVSYKQNELEELKSVYGSTQKQLEYEQKQLNAIQVDNVFEKKAFEAFKMRNKDLSIKIKENEYTTSRFQDLEYKLEEREKLIEELKIKLAEKTSEWKHAKESYSRTQNEMGALRRDIAEMEETFKEREELLENDLKNVLARLETNHDQLTNLRSDYDKKINSLEEIILEKDSVIRKLNSIGFDTSQLLNSSSSIPSYDNAKKQMNFSTYKPMNLIKEVDYQTNLNANLSSKENIDNKQMISNQLHAEEQRKLKEKLQNTILQKANAFEKSNTQRKENLNSLKSKLHDIEMMTTSMFHNE